MEEMQISQSQLNLASELLFREQEIIKGELWRKTNIEDDLDRKNQQHKEDMQSVTEKIAAGEDIQAQGQRLLRIQRLQEGYSRILQTKQEEEEKEDAQTDQLFNSFKSALARRKQKAAKLLAESEECCQMFQKQREDKENVRPILQQPLDIFHDCETIPASDYFVSKAEISEAEKKGHESALSLLHKTARALKANAIESVKELQYYCGREYKVVAFKNVGKLQMPPGMYPAFAAFAASTSVAFTAFAASTSCAFTSMTLSRSFLCV